MQSPLELDELTLNAFVDGQLDCEQEREVLAAMQSDAQIRDMVCKLRRAKDWMRTGFADAAPRTPAPQPKRLRRFSLGYSVAASVMALALASGGAVLGYVCAEREQPLLSHQQKADHVILHLDESSSEKFAAVLDYAERFLAEHAARGVEVEVIANAGGIDLMRTGGSAFASRVRTLQQQYDNLHFIACANAIRNLRKEGVDVSMLDGVHTGDTAVDHIVNRLQHGWRYVKVSDLPEI